MLLNSELGNHHGCFGSSRDFFSAEFDPRMVDEDFVSMTWCLMMFLQLWRTECQL